jgi:hypothetical protein
MFAFPIVFELLVALQHGEQAEVHGAHIEAAHLRFGAQRGGQAFLGRHTVTTARGDVDDGIAVLLDARQELHEDFRVGRRAAVLGITRMQMDD